MLEPGDGFLADFISICITEFNWTYRDTMNTPLPIIITALRGQRRRRNKWQGFGWIALDEIQRRKTFDR